MPSSDEDLKKAMKAFRKRWNVMRLDAESSLGHGPLSGTGKVQIGAIRPPAGFAKEIWEELADKGLLKRDTMGFYEMVGKS
jgi:hypothetical protein